MKNKSEVQFAETGNRQGDTPASKPVDRHRFLNQVAGALAAGALAIFLLCRGVAPAQDDDTPAPPSCASTSASRSVDSDKLIVPDDAHLPPPRLPGGTITNDPTFPHHRG